jgi:hypothetical protein
MNEISFSVLPILAMFYGIIVYMFSEKNKQHNKPHIHVEYQGKEAVIAIDGEVLRGEIPVKQLKMTIGWMAIHEDELLADWKLLSEGKEYFKIEPLK